MKNIFYLVTAALNILTFIFIAYLTMKELENFFEKPTLVTNLRKKIEPRHFPVITVCPIPSINRSGLDYHGYKNIYAFALGRYFKNNNKIGWLGIHNNTDDIMEDISILRKADSCPKVEAIFEENRYDKKFLATNLTTAFHPYGKCCEVQIPNNAANETLVSVGIDEPKWQGKGNKTYKGFRVFLSNKESYHQFFKNKFNMNGPKALVEFKYKERFIFYNVKISEEITLPIDSKDSCRNYAYANDYKEVSVEKFSYHFKEVLF